MTAEEHVPATPRLLPALNDRTALDGDPLRQRAGRGLVLHHGQRRRVLPRRTARPEPAAPGVGNRQERDLREVDGRHTQYKGVQCTLPLLGDDYGLYDNKKIFAAAGIPQPTRTFSQLKPDAVNLTEATSSGYQQLGFMQTFHMYENALPPDVAVRDRLAGRERQVRARPVPPGCH